MSRVRAGFLLLSLALLTPLRTWSADESSEGKRLHQLLDAEWEWTLKEHPLFATNLGDLRYNDRWPDLSLEAVARRKQHHQQTLQQLKTLDRSKLGKSVG